MDVFISWSGEQSQAVATAMASWLPSVLQFVKPFLSEDIEKGARFQNAISQKLQQCNFGIICATKASVKSSWVLFEAGALSKLHAESRVCTFLLGMKKGEVPLPLGQFQATEPTEHDTRKLVKTINSRSPLPLDDLKVDRAFDKWWADFDADIQNARAITDRDRDETSAAKGALTSTEMTAEILSCVREIREHIGVNAGASWQTWGAEGKSPSSDLLLRILRGLDAKDLESGSFGRPFSVEQLWRNRNLRFGEGEAGAAAPQ